MPSSYVARWRSVLYNGSGNNSLQCILIFSCHTIAKCLVYVPLYGKYFCWSLLERPLIVNNTRSCSFTVRWRMNSYVLIELWPYCVEMRACTKRAHFYDASEEYANPSTGSVPIYVLTSTTMSTSVTVYIWFIRTNVLSE